MVPYPTTSSFVSSAFFSVSKTASDFVASVSVLFSKSSPASGSVANKLHPEEVWIKNNQLILAPKTFYFFEGLHVSEVEIDAALFLHERFVRALLHHSPIHEADDLVCILHRWEAVCDNHCCPTLDRI